MANPYYIEPAGQGVGGKLAGLGTIIAAGREKKKQQEEQAAQEQRMADAQAAIMAAYESQDPLQMAKAATQYPEFVETIKETMGIQGQMADQQSQEMSGFLGGMLANPQTALQQAQQRYEMLQAAGRDPTQTAGILEGLSNPETATQELKNIEMLYATMDPEGFKAYQAASKEEKPYQAATDLGKLTQDFEAGLINAEDYAAAVSNVLKKTPSAATDAGKLKQDLDAGLITQEQYDAGIAALNTGKSSKPTASERLAAGYAERTTDASETLTQLGEQFTGLLSRGAGLIPQGIKSEDRQLFEQAERNFINATLRRESGAAIAPSEFESARLQYIPQPGDGEALLEQKQRNRETVSRALQLEAGEAYKELRNAMGDFEPMPAGDYEDGTIAVNADGVEIIVQDGMWVENK